MHVNTAIFGDSHGAPIALRDRVCVRGTSAFSSEAST